MSTFKQEIRRLILTTSAVVLGKALKQLMIQEKYVVENAVTF